jgi:hypothetical protein
MHAIFEDLVLVVEMPSNNNDRKDQQRDYSHQYQRDQMPSDAEWSTGDGGQHGRTRLIRWPRATALTGGTRGCR